MMRTLLDRLLGEGAEPETVDLDAARGDPECGKLIATGCADPRAFYDAEALRRLGRGARLRAANWVALDVARHCPRWFDERGDPARDLLFCAWVPSRYEPVAVEAELFAEGGRARRVSPMRDGTEPSAWAELDGATALELEAHLRGFWSLPTIDGPQGYDGETWYLVRAQRERHHVVRRFCPRGAARELFVGTLRHLGVDVEAQRAAEEARWAAQARDDLRQQVRDFVEQRAQRCAWSCCELPPRRGDPSGLCEAHRRRVDAQGANLRKKRPRP
jgi:hypothetical protein